MEHIEKLIKDLRAEGIECHVTLTKAQIQGWIAQVKQVEYRDCIPMCDREGNDTLWILRPTIEEALKALNEICK